MQLLNTTPYHVGYLLGQLRHPTPSLSVVVKGTFVLRQGEAAVAADVQLPLAADTPGEDDEAPASLRYPADLVHYKPRADVMLVGTCHAGPRPVQRCEVALSVGGWKKALTVVGDRHWGDLGPSSAQAFRSMPLGYERALGGPGSSANPLGCGRVPSRRGDGPSVIWLPNVEEPGRPVTGPGSSAPPAGFGPLRRSWSPRQEKVGTYGPEWQARRWPWYPEDFDWSHQNAAPDDMQRPFLQGSEAVELTHLHPEHALFRSALPGSRVRCFLAPPLVDGGAPRLRELPMQLDTVWIDADALTLVLVWRGVVDVVNAEAADVGYLYVTAEALSEPEVALTVEQARFDGSLTAPAEEEELVPLEAAPGPEEDAELERVMAEAEQRTREQLRAAGLDPDNLPIPTEEQKQADAERLAALGLVMADFEAEPEPWTRERVVARAAEGGAFTGEDLSGLDLSGLGLSKLDFRGADLRGARLAGAKLDAARFDGAVLAGADLEGAELSRAQLTDADLTGANLRAVTGEGTVFGGALLEGAVLADARLLELWGEKLSAPKADLTRAVLRGARLLSANLSGCTLDGADLRDAQLKDATLEGARGSGLDARAADLTGLRAGEGAAFPGARFEHAQAAGSNWQAADLALASFAGATLCDANLSSCRLQKADLSSSSLQAAQLRGADLRGARLRFANLFEATLEGADVRDADFTGASLYGAETWKAELAGARFEQANLKRTKLAR